MKNQTQNENSGFIKYYIFSTTQIFKGKIKKQLYQKSIKNFKILYLKTNLNQGITASIEKKVKRKQ